MDNPDPELNTSDNSSGYVEPPELSNGQRYDLQQTGSVAIRKFDLAAIETALKSALELIADMRNPVE